MTKFLKDFSTYLKFTAVFLVLLLVAAFDYYSFYERTRKIEFFEELNDRFGTIQVSIIKLEYTLDMFIVARRFEDTTVGLIKSDIVKLDKELYELVTNPKYFYLINENIMLSDGLVSIVEDWQIVKSEIGSLSEASTQGEVMLIHNAVDLKTILIQEATDRLVGLIVESRNQVLLETRTRVFWTIGGFFSVLILGFFFLYKRIISQAKEASMTALLVKSTESGSRFVEGRGVMGSLMADLNVMLDSIKKDGEVKIRQCEHFEEMADNRACQISALMAINTIAASSLSQDEVLEAGVKEVVGCVGSGAAMVYLDDEHGLRLRASNGVSKSFCMDGAIIPQFIKNLHIGSNSSVVVYDSMDEYPNERFAALMKQNGLNSMVSVQIHFNETLYGYLYVSYTDSGAISIDNLPYLEAVASGFGTYISYINRFRKEYDSKTFLEVLINQLPFGIAIYDRSGTCRMINSTHKKFLGVRSNDHVVGSFRVFEDDVLVEQGMVMSIKKSYEGYATEFIINYDPGAIKRFSFNGVPKKLRITSIPLYDSGGEIANIALLYDAVSEMDEDVGGAD